MNWTTKTFAAFATAALLTALGPIAGVSADGHGASGGTVDGGAIATMQPLTIAVSLPAEAHLSARSWLFMIETPEGEAIESISVETTAEFPASSADTSPLPSGSYVVRILFGSQIATTCTDGIFYETVLPSSGARTIAIVTSPVLTMFSFAECAGAQEGLGVSIDSAEEPSGEASGTSNRVGTLDDPLPPDTGSGGLRPAGGSSGSGLMMVVAVLLLLVALGGFTARPVRARIRI